MRSWLARVLLVVLGLGLGVAACGDDDPTKPSWRLAQEDLDGAILGLWGPSRSDLFAVGGTLAPDGGAALVLWHDGTQWWRMPIVAPSLWWTHGFAHDDVWAVGERGTVVHFDGSEWITVETGAAYTLWGIWGASSAEMWAVGGDPVGGGPGVLRRWDGLAWTDVAGLDTTEDMFFKVWGAAADDVYVVGDRGAILHWDGATWTRLASPVTSRLVTVTGRGAGDVWAVGGLGTGLLVHDGGAGFASLDIGEQAGLMGVWTAPGQPVLAAGFYGVVLLGDEAGWEVQPSVTQQCLHAVWGDGQGTYVLGGGDLFSPGARRGVLIAAGDISTAPVLEWTARVVGR